ncbi:MAG: DNA-directed RNA polymerase subunit beta' [Candidatus Wildermuthbacteria bacterium RIFCSPHIGHO2_01_FULL_47_27]|uniref:DNA-directed RNA polymerase subunit beta' n=2 Tax=Candidatus Wildermuthiibacteriota TaxID=1817923 RepID=A0A1G2RRR4_9BACT|nr:MAG: DNA-directed RNA polymerase subunit beta' [Parcubacteria group bacterium GW2011_GWA2_47_9]OHA63787.1 MAG: DNA-directed RNA polymerase subunit beta' [Candidatus Wildermuthbacteria bacterium RIFCSPHIGHO2_01_FULL_47_27]OHA68924.1 MAG: DNA-directed RNA polymerase subunit beta' [Candidatus Wildermuthbacteria bacterium RIFCSPHIGHO2_02_FULL_47_17]OHA75527.1 MAG: DNA-directed RNA polymerase subunit beta' [Candidatus Wildermuthbacteria bacterium RIFCSPLOWO2_01_FULL_48_35]
MRVADLQSIRIKLASPEDILSWSHGEVTKAETINYRTQRSEMDGLFCERIFGPEKDYQCYCGKYQRIRYKGVICDKCGVEVTKSAVRRERMGHIKLAAPVSHIWFLRGVPSSMGMVLDIPMLALERTIYFSSYIILKVDEEAKKRVLEDIDKEYKKKIKASTAQKEESRASAGIKGGPAHKNVSPDLKVAKDQARQEVSSLYPLRVLSEAEYREYSLKYGEVFEAGTGAETVRKLFEKIDIAKEIENIKKRLIDNKPQDRKKHLRRLRLFQGMQKAGLRPEWMFMTMLPVLPPDLRPMVQLGGGRYASSDLNDLYRRVINRNNRLKYLLEIDAPEVIVRNEKRMLQEAVDALIDNGMRVGQTTTATTGGKRLLKSLADMLKGKQGRFRQNLLGKRVDYSGRSVIVVGPELAINQCGLPKEMALELFRPMVIRKILEAELAYNVRGASKLIEDQTPEVWAMLEEVVKDKLVLLNRAPTLHKLGIQAFRPLLIEGHAIRLHPSVCKAFNADFDGDQMAVHVPLSEEAQKEAKERMLSSANLLKPATGTPIVTPSQDIILGCYFLTSLKDEAMGEGMIFDSPEEAIIAYDFGLFDLGAKIKVRGIKGMPQTAELLETSAGRILFNEAMPKDHAFINDVMNSKRLDKIVSALIEKYGIETSAEVLDKIKNLGFEYATVSGVSWGMDDLVVPKEKPKIISAAEKSIEKINEYFRKGLLSSEEKRIQTIEVWQKAKSEIEKLVPKALPQGGSVFSIVDAGARGSWSQPVQMSGMKGLVINPAGQIIELPVKSSFKEGFDVLEYFISTHGARKGTADTALRTSTAGYLTRRLVDVAHEIVVAKKDCGETEGFTVFLSDAAAVGQKPIFKLVGRIALVPIKDKAGNILVKKGQLIDWEKVDAIIQAGIEEVRIKSPLICKLPRGVCQLCYGWDLSCNRLVKFGEAVGIVAAQAIGEPGTQLTMRTFHTGGVAGGGDITLGLPRVEEVFEARSPGGKAIIAEVAGRVAEITPERLVRIKPKSVSAIDSALDSANSSAGKPKNKNKEKKGEIVEYQIPPRAAIWVEIGQEVLIGQQLCEGSIDPQELFRVAGEEAAKRYLVQEIQKIYATQGASIHDKHIEVIVRQMFSRVRVRDEGDSFFVPGQIVELAQVMEENARLKKEKKKLVSYQQLLFGISKVSLSTDSFLSAASFQETSRVLIRAAIEGKEDRLRGLKENVIIGKLIPAGTGFPEK